MHVDIIQCPELGTVFQRRDGLRITFGTHITIFFTDSVKLMLQMKTSEGNLAFPLPDDESLHWFLASITKGKFGNRPTTYEYLEAKMTKGGKDYHAFLPWHKEED